MEWYTVFIFVFGMLMGTMFTGLPVAFALMTVNLVGLVLFAGGTVGLSLAPGSIVDSVSSFPMIAIPMFYLMGEVLHESHVIDLLFELVDKWIGRIPGKHLYVAIAGGAALAALSGSGSADVAIIGRTVQPVLEQRKYDRRLSYSAVLAGGALGPIIPPSGLAIILAGLANVSAGGLLLAGLVPGVLLAGLFGCYVTFRIWLNPSLAPPNDDPDVPWSEKWLLLLRCLPFTLIILMVLGFIMFGISTPSEAAATGAISAIVLSALYGRLTLKVLVRSVMSTARLTAMVFLIIAGAVLFGRVLALSGLEGSLSHWLLGLGLHPMVLAALLLALLLILGMFMEAMSLIVLLAPLYSAVLRPAGIDPIWFFFLFLMTLPIGNLTAPVGNALFILQAVVPNARITNLYRAGAMTALIAILGLIITFMFPELATAIPHYANLR